MDQNTCYIKTDAGRNELRARQLGLSPKLRALLVMIDGRQSVMDYLLRLKEIGIDEHTFDQLYKQGLIEPIFPQTSSDVVISKKIESVIAPIEQMPAISLSEPIVQHEFTQKPQASRQQVSLAVFEPQYEEEELQERRYQERRQEEIERQRLRQIYEFYITTIRDNIGLRGFMLQVDVENAQTLDEYRALQKRYVNALDKTAPEPIARLLKIELERLLS